MRDEEREEWMEKGDRSKGRGVEDDEGRVLESGRKDEGRAEKVEEVKDKG